MNIIIYILICIFIIYKSAQFSRNKKDEYLESLKNIDIINKKSISRRVKKSFQHSMIYDGNIELDEFKSNYLDNIKLLSSEEDYEKHIEAIWVSLQLKSI